MKITPSQAMLVLFDKYLKVRKNLSEQLEKAGEVDWDELETDIYENEVKIAELKELYISGAQTAEQKTQLDKWMRDDALNAYEISYDYNFINNDPSRRYFESHLSLETIKLHLADLSATDLEKHRDFILNYSRLDPINRSN